MGISLAANREAWAVSLSRKSRALTGALLLTDSWLLTYSHLLLKE